MAIFIGEGGLSEGEAEAAAGPLLLGDWIGAGMLACCTFAAFAYLACAWKGTGALSEYNVLFDADAGARLSSFANGWPPDGLHPLLAYYFSPFIRVIQALGKALWPGSNGAAVRLDIALLICPFFAALKGACLYLAFRLLRLHTFEAAMGAMIGVAAFSSAVFGAVPESYGVTSGIFALITLLCLARPRANSLISTIALYLAGLVAAGTTISNGNHLVWIEFVRRSRQKNVAKTLIVSGLLGLSTIILAIGAGAILDSHFQKGPVSNELRMSLGIVGYFAPTISDQILHLEQLPEFYTRTFVPLPPARVENKIAEESPDSRIKFEFTYNVRNSIIVKIVLGLISIAVLGGGMVVAYLNGGEWRQIGCASGISLLLFGVFYSFFGLNTYLYSQSWVVQSTVLIAAWFRLRLFRTIPARAILGTALLLLLAGDLYVLNSMTNQMIAGSHA